MPCESPKTATLGGPAGFADADGRARAVPPLAPETDQEVRRMREAEIRRAPRQSWRPGSAGPFFVVAAPSREIALREAREFVTRHG